MPAKPLCALPWLIWGLVLVPRVARAQIPLPPLSEVEGPALRLAGQDPLKDRLLALSERLDALLKKRRPVAERAEQQLESLAEGDAPVSETLRSLTDAYEKEVRTLARGRELAADGLALLEVDVPRQVSAGFSELVDAASTAERLRLLAAQRDAKANRLDAGETVLRVNTATTGTALRLGEQHRRIETAESLEAQGEALRTRARLRLAERRLQALRSGLEIGPEALEKAQARLTKAREERARAEAELERIRARRADTLARTGDAPRTVLRRSAAEVAVTRAERSVAEADARVNRGQVESTLLRSLIRGTAPKYPATVQGEALTSRRADAEEAELEMEARLSEVQADLGSAPPGFRARLLSQLRDDLEAALKLTRAERQALQASLNLQRLFQEEGTAYLRRTPLDWVRLLALSVAVVVGALFLLVRGFRFLNGLDRRFSKAQATQQGPRVVGGRIRSPWFTTALVTFPMLVLGGALTVLIWPIWQAPWTLQDITAAIDRPLFYVDDRPISVLSLGKLILTVWVTVVLSRLVRGFLSTRVFRSLAVDIGFANTLNTFVHYSFLIVGLSIGLRFVGVGLSSFAILAGVLGIGIGFGLRNVAENFISGLIVLIERPIQVGDWIDVDGSVEGQVQSIRARSTTLRTRDNISIIIPNSEFVGRQVTNWSHGDPKVRLRIKVGVAYGSDTDLVRRSLLEVAERHGRVLERPAPEVQFRGFGASSLDFQLLVWIEEQLYRFRIESDLHFAIDATFRRKAIVIAFPQIDVHLKTVERGAAEVLRGRGLDPDAEDEPAGPPGGSGPARERRAPQEPIPLPESRSVHTRNASTSERRDGSKK